MTEVDRMSQRAKIETMLGSYNKEQRKEILNDIELFKTLLNSEDISSEIIGLLIFLYGKNK